MTLTYISVGVILVYLIIKGKKALHMLQQNLYNENNRYIKWIKGNLITSFINLDILSMIGIIVAYGLKNDALLVVSMIIYIIDAYRIITIRKDEQVKKPVIPTTLKLVIDLSFLCA